MKRIVTVVETTCDHPACTEEGSQPTSSVQFWVYVTAKGRRTNPITIELCDAHRDEVKGLFQFMQKFDQKED